MLVPFAEGQILEIAVETERQGAAFYDALATQAKSQRVREECERLAEFEREHERLFRQLLAQEHSQQALQSVQAGDVSDERYLLALVESNMLPDEEAARRLAEEADSEVDAINIALQMEKNTILFYRELQDILGEQAGVLATILDAARAHVYELHELQQYLQQ